MTEEVHRYVMGYKAGEGFNDKFDRLVNFFMREETGLRTRVKQLQKEKEKLEDEILAYRRISQDLRLIDARVRQITAQVSSGSVLPGQQAM
jgi:hypothetical protein